MKHLRVKNRFMMFLLFLFAIAAFGAIVMGLWNAILPAVLEVKTISFIQALGILLLSKILFGGFGGRRPWNRGQHWKEGMRQKWGMMSPEEQLKFKAEWEKRCSKWGAWKQTDTNDASPFEAGQEH
jgi:Ca2+/H+ antiporter, TMEM165/GDT1 family